MRNSPVEVRLGPGVVWSGAVISTDESESGIAVTAYGYSRFATDYGARDGNLPTTRVDYAVNGAIARGWPVTVASMPAWTATPVAGVDTARLNTTENVLTEGTKTQGVRWTVREDKVLRFETAGAEVKWVTRVEIGRLGLADDDYVTHIGLRTLTMSGSPRVTWVGDDSPTGPAARWGRREALVDWTGLGNASDATATFWATNLLAQVPPRLGFTETLTVALRDLTTVDAIPAHPAQVQAGDLIRLDGIYDEGATSAASSITITIGQVSYTDGEDSLTIAPAGLVTRNLTDLIADITEPPALLAG
ncbi:hypothetical protein [Nocardioides kribbensis]|uniref:Minor tail protein n=1 Tax=Nocardioides kribbensis TaxID=305517 RepID=A0ABV1NZ04_9ACTN